ncbi:iron reductase domain protein [Aulographum hederae CBS 113979]|uniref:Iron reductase domain protein n=1 Tax=Aulographum hederae CBS 113979 TaxID=1176131 RepID=A0A6G1GWS6_9PEZI|nr:iron reductase domain protein [Aulographum hederae CBS 113979]
MKTYTAAALLSLGSTVSAQVSSYTAGGSISFGLNIPDSGNDLFFQLKAPTSYSWVALGQGTSMSGSQIFVMYTSADGNNVTVSPRKGEGHSEPQHDSAQQITLLEGTGVADGVMTANVRCSTCGSFEDYSSAAGSWIWASNTGSSLNSDDLSATISRHGNTGSPEFDFSQAKGGSSANPLTAAGGSTGTSGGGSGCGSSSGSGSSSAGSGGNSATGTPTQTGFRPPWATGTNVPTGFPSGFPGNQFDTRQSNDDACEDSSAGGAAGGAAFSNRGGFTSLTSDQQRAMLMAHGILASLAFVIFFPLGGIVIRLLSFAGLLKLHAAIQLLATVMFIAAFGIGVYIATGIRILDTYHPIIGIVLFVLLFFQPILGVIHHKLFKQYQRRTFWSHAHLWLGRSIIVLGIINGGLGLKVAGNSRSGEIAYGVVAAIMFLAYAASAVYGELKRSNTPPPPKYTESPIAGHSAQGSPETREAPAPREFYGERPK